MKQQTYFKILILFVLLIAGFTYSQQSDTTGSQKFLWFRGHWDKKQNNTFLINSFFGGGGKATIKNDCSVKLQTSGIQAWNKQIDDGIENIDKWKYELNKPSVDRQEYAHHYNLALMPFLEQLKKEWKQYKVDPNKNLLSPEQTAIQRFSDSLDNWCQKVKPKYEAIMRFYKQHRHDGLDDLKNPPPPEFDYDCAGCDTSIQNNQDTIAKHYVDKFSKPESDLIHDGLSILRELVLLGATDDIGGGHIDVVMSMDMKEAIYNAFAQHIKDPSKAGACSYIDANKLSDAIYFLVNRLLERADKLVRDNRKNFRTVKCVSQVYFSAARNAILFGVGMDNFEHSEDFQEITYMLRETFDFYYNKLAKEHDWSQITNIPFLISTLRNISLMGGSSNEDGEAIQNINKILNSFQLQIEMDIKIGGGGGYIINHLKGKSKIAPEFNWDTNQCYTWVAALDQPNQLGEPVKQGAGIIHMDLLDNEIVASHPHPVYIGTHKYYTELKLLKMDFCHPGQDTLLFTRFIPDPAGDGMWKVPDAPNEPYELFMTDNYFKSNNKTIELAKSGVFKQQAETAAEKEKELAAKLQAMKSKYQSGNFNMSDIHKLQDMVNQSQSSFNNKNLSPVFYIDFPLQIHNGTTTIFHKRFDSKEVSPITARAVIYGYMTIDITYIGK